MGFTVESDDEVKRVRKVFLGPTPRNGEGGILLPFHASYEAYRAFAVLAAGGLTLLGLLGFPGGPALVVWALALSVLGATAFTRAVDHDRPAGAALRSGLAALRGYRPAPAPRRERITTARRVKITRTPL